MHSDRWRRLLRLPGALPPLPEVLLRLQAGLYQLDLDIDQLCAEVQRDPALTSEIIKLINSPLFGMPSRIASLRQAVVLLGLRRVRAIILSQSLRQSLACYNSPGFALFKWWDRSLLSAVTATMLCQRCSPDHVEEAYLAGLVADIGVLVMARYEPRFERLLAQQARCSAGQLCLASRQALGYDHAALGAEVLAEWKFPAPVVTAVRLHIDRAQLGAPDAALLSQAVCLACMFTDCVATGSQADADAFVSASAARFVFGEDELANFVRSCMQGYREQARPLGHGALGLADLPAGLASA